MKNIIISIKITLVFCVLLFVGYVLVLWGVAGISQPDSGRAEVVRLDGRVVGAVNVGQNFTEAHYFWPRPSAVDYDGSASGGSNKGVSDEQYLAQVASCVDTFLVAHPYLNREQVPSEMVTASGSGLDPHISLASAMVQAERVATARGVAVEDVVQIIERVAERPLVGPVVVNVLLLNVEMDKK